MASLPESVRIREVGPRDGFQNEPEVIPTAEKVRLIGMLGDAGPAADRGDLVRAPRRDPAARRRRARCCAAYERRDGVAYSVLIPNERGLERALAQRERFDEVNLFLSASETHNRKNVNRSIAESLAGLERVIAARPRRGAALRGRDLDQLRLPVRGRGAGRAGARDRRAPGGGRLRGGRVRRHDRDGEPAPGGRVLRRGARAPRRGRADRPLPQHPRPGPRQRARGAATRASTRSSRPSASSAAARFRRARPATSRPRTWSRCCEEMGIDDRGRPAGADRRLAAPSRSCSAARSAPTCCAPGPSTGTGTCRDRIPFARRLGDATMRAARFKARRARRRRTSRPSTSCSPRTSSSAARSSSSPTRAATH